MSELPHKNHDAPVVDTQLTNNPKLTAWFTDYQEVIARFPHQTLISYVNNYNKYVHDPVKAEKDFYLNLNTHEDTPVKLSTVDNTDIDVEVYKDKQYWEDNGKSLDSIKSSVHKAEPADGDIVEEAALKDVLDLDIQFVLYWVEEFRCIHSAVKEEIWTDLPKELEGGAYNTDNIYCNDFNESMFLLGDSEYIKDRTTLTPLDVTNSFADGNPSMYNYTTRARLDEDTFETADELGNKTSSLFKKNIINHCMNIDRDVKNIVWDIKDKTDNTHSIPSGASDSVEPELDTTYALSIGNHSPHGHNLAADIHHAARVSNNNLDIQTKMEEILGHMKKVLEFLDKTRVKDTQKWGRFNHKLMIEQAFTSVDQAKSELHEIFEDVPLGTTKNTDLI